MNNYCSTNGGLIPVIQRSSGDGRPSDLSTQATIVPGLLCLILLVGCNGKSTDDTESSLNDEAALATNVLQAELRTLIASEGGAQGLEAFILPESSDLTAIPQDPNNPLTPEKVALGKMLFHDTAFALNGVSADEAGSWSCATCHHAAAGFKSGIPQGIGEGGIGFGADGSRRILADGFDVEAADGAPNKPDLQPLSSPTILNSAYQDVMLWNGQFGNAAAGSVNSTVPAELLMTPNTPKAENKRQLSGLEIQAIAGMSVHRLKMAPDTPLQTNAEYRNIWSAAYGDESTVITGDAGKAIAAYERTVLANKAPFQLWLRGDTTAMSESEINGALLFFGEAGCVDCHRGPALSSEHGASVSELFFAVGFGDFDASNEQIHTIENAPAPMGRFELTGNDEDRFKFKIPPLYNLADADIYGHGASFHSIDDVLDYKNSGISQNSDSIDNLDTRFTALNLNDQELSDLSAFLTKSLYDPDLQRYQPESVPSESCVIVDPFDLPSDSDFDCLGGTSY